MTASVDNLNVWPEDSSCMGCAEFFGILRWAQDDGANIERLRQMLRLGDDFERTHHVVGFVFEDVAVVEVSAGVAFEADDDTGDGAGRALNGVLPAKFVGVGCGGGGGEAEFFVE